MTTPTWLDIAERNPDAVHRVYGCEQATEILGRTRRIVDRIMPRSPVPHGFYNPEGFVAASRLSSHQRLLARSVQQRVSKKVLERDRHMTALQKAEAMVGRRLTYRPGTFRYRTRDADS